MIIPGTVWVLFYTYIQQLLRIRPEPILNPPVSFSPTITGIRVSGANVGELFHELIARRIDKERLRGDDFYLIRAAWNCLQYFLKPRPDSLRNGFYVRKHGVTGIMDAIYTASTGQRTILEFKLVPELPSVIKIPDLAQLGGYRLALDQEVAGAIIYIEKNNLKNTHACLISPDELTATARVIDSMIKEGVIQ